MIEDNKVDLGSIQIHKKVIADIASSAIADIDGVRLVTNDIAGKFSELFGKKNFSGVIIHIDKNNQVVVEVKVSVRYGINIPDIAHIIQDSVRTAIEKTVDIDLKDVNVNIQGIERGEK